MERCIVFITPSSFITEETVINLVKPIKELVGEQSKKVKILSLRQSDSPTWALAKKFNQLFHNSPFGGHRTEWEDRDFWIQLKELKDNNNSVVSFVDYSEKEIAHMFGRLGFKFERQPKNLFYFAKF